MRPFNDIEKFVRCEKPIVKTSEQLDRQTLNDSYAAMTEAVESASKSYQTGIFRFALQSKATRLFAAAAVIIVVISLFLGRDGHTPEIPAPAQPETRLISMMSMRASYQRGGFDALDQQFRETLDVLGPRSSGVSMKELLDGSNGS
jgi:hypothetical protein